MLRDTNLALPLVTLAVSLLKINRTTYVVSTIGLNLTGDKLPSLSSSSKASHSLNGVYTGFMAHCLGKEVT